ncbi:MAG: FAD-linked oxidase C-terminal domain-containing protein [Opitutales bacterium]|nr:FAD-linked oxidase C-terminal domain-containing protein [Opitutales bacterium]
MPKKSALSELKRRLRGSVKTDAETLYWKSFDSSKLSFPIEAVIQPKNDREIGTLLKLANKHKVPVTTRGSGTCLTGAASPKEGGWVLDLSGWKKIRVDRETGMAYVETGAVLENIKKRAEKVGWYYPPDPSSKRFCSIGGTIACNAGGMTGAKYGVTRDYIYALEGFLPNGEFVRWASDVRKYVSGYNMKDLWIGSEGTLGVITRAVLRLIPKPPLRWTLLTAFKSDAKALAAIRALTKDRIVPAILEFLDDETVLCAERRTGKPFFPGVGTTPMVLLELDGYKESLERDRKKVLAWAKERGLQFSETYDDEEAEQLWAVRRQSSPAMYELGNTKLNEDIVVPLRKTAHLIRFVNQLKKETGLAIPTFGHAADGNFHVNIMFNRGDKKQERIAEKAVVKLMKTVVAMGGAITGEHGVGLAKSPFLKFQHNKAEIAAMRAIKEVLDPNNILNPGKIFEPYIVWQKTPEKVQLPWDHK